MRELLKIGGACSAAGRVDEAKQAYLAALAREPANVEAMTGLGELLARIGMFADARTVLEEALRVSPAHADAHRVLVIVLAALGEQAAADEHSRRDFALRPIEVTPFTGTGDPIRLLLVTAAAGVNTRTARFRDARIFETIRVAAEYVDADDPLPQHDLVFNAVGEAERAFDALAAAERLVARTDRPVINHPRGVRAANRVDNAVRLGALGGVRTARTRRITRRAAADPDVVRELGLPLLLRVPGHHTGEYFERIDELAQVEAALARLPGDELLAMSFLDARDVQGRYRKYRMMIVDGRLYPLHAAVGEHWKLHFFSATHGAAERAIDEVFLADPKAVIGARAIDALEAITGALGLDYGGVDFAVDRDGAVLVFEANASMTVPEPDPDPTFAYRNASLDAVAAAVIRMLRNRARSATALPRLPQDRRLR